MLILNDDLPCWLYKNELVKYFMQHDRIRLIIRSTYRLKKNNLKTDFTEKETINMKKSRTANEIASLGKIIYSYVTITRTNEKITCTRSHDTRMKK